MVKQPSISIHWNTHGDYSRCKARTPFMKAINHPTLKNLWLDLVAVMQWVELDEQELKRIDGTRRQFRFGI